MEMRYFSMFSGIAGFENGIEKAFNNKYESEKSGQADSGPGRKRDINKRQGSVLSANNAPLCVGYSEIDKYAIQIYEKHFPGHKNWGSATDIIPEELPDFDMLCGGFPCQAFSIAGKRLGFKDTRGTLFFDIARIIKVKRPRIVFLENVKGLLNHSGGRTFAVILATLDELGYNVEWEVLNSKNFGVPQNRERVFIIGHLRGTSSRQIFPLGQGNFKNNEESTLHNITRTITTAHAHGTAKHMSYIKTKKIIGKVKVRKYIVNVEELKKLLKEHKNLSIKEIAEKLNIKKTTVEHWFRADNCFAIPDENVWFKLKNLLNIQTDEFDKSITEFEIRDNDFDQSNRVYMKEGISPTLTGMSGGQQHSIVDDGYSIRRLTPVECEFLQSFPKNWTKFGIETFNNLETYYRGYGKKKKTDSIEILQRLWETVGEEQIKKWGFRESLTLWKEEILQPRMYEEELQVEISKGCFGTTRELQSKAINYCNRMFSLWKERKVRYSSQRQKQVEQLFRELTSSLQKLPYQITSKGRLLEQPTFEKQKEERQGTIYVISDISDTQRYKCLGNAVTTNVITAIVERMIDNFTSNT